jgi:Tfp pilus assembly protein PilV
MNRAGATVRFAHRHGRRRAFTFIEVLATMAFLAVVLPAVMSGISLCLSAAKLAKQQTRASSLAYAKLVELAAVAPMDQAEMIGDFGPEEPEYRWAARMSDWDGDLLRELDVAVTWRYRGKDRDVVLSTLVNTGGPQ